MYSFDYEKMWEIFTTCLKYIPITVLIAALTLINSIIFGMLIAMMRNSTHRILRWLSTAYVLMIRGVPILVILFLVYNLSVRSIDALSVKYGLSFNSATVPKFWYAVAAFSLCTSAFMGESIRTALLSVPPGQYEAGYSIGMTKFQTMIHIVIPQALPVALPIMGNHFINLIKSTAIVSMIGIVDVLNAALIKVNTSFKYLEAYVVVALIYWVLTILTETLIRKMTRYAKRKLGDFTEEKPVRS